MPERRGSHRTEEGIELQQKHQKTYEKWWLGKVITTNLYKNFKDSDEFISGRVVAVNYLGNSMVGVVELTLECGYVYLVGGGGTAYRPRKKDVKVIQE